MTITTKFRRDDLVWCIVEEAEELITGRLADMIEPEAKENVA